MTCAHGYPTPAACVDCHADGSLPPVPKPAPEKVDYQFVARLFTDCQGCSLPIRIGDECVRTTFGRVMHERCGP